MIRLRGVGVEYRTANGSIQALKELDLDVKVEFVAIVGPSGCGKSTLLRVLAGLLIPTSGRLEFDSNDKNFSYGIVFQDYSLLPWLTTQQNIELGLRVKGTSDSKRNQVSKRLLKQLDLADAAHLLPHHLSGGMRQRVAVGRAFAPSPRLLLMDEPFGALDAITREDLQETLTRLYESDCHTIVFVTHDVEEALILSDRICVLTPRPGSVRAIVDVPFLRPRRQQCRRDPRFIDLKNKIEDLLRERSSHAQE